MPHAFPRSTLTPLFRAYWRLTRSMTLGVRGIALDADGRVMLVRHTYTDGWHLPGGGVERGETADAAMRKEFVEEAGLAVEGPMRLVGAYLNTAFPGDHVLVFVAQAWRPCASDSDGEIAERGFFDRHALPSGVRPSVAARLAEALDGTPLSPVW